MMPSVIPARLQFQCGHAALVTLPRVKGETTTQRNDRVAREKSAALARECDFCAPANGTNHAVSDTSAIPMSMADINTSPAETLVAESSPVETPVSVVVAAASPSETFVVDGSPTETSVVDSDTVVVEPAAPKPARKQRVKRQASAAEVARGQRFLVEYRLERTLRADSIHDALRQLASFGAADVVAITRED